MKLPLPLALALLTAAALAAPFGPGLPLAGEGQKQVRLHPDLGGDKTPDEVWLVRVQGRLPPGMKPVNPFGRDKTLPKEGELALAVALSRNQGLYLLGGSGFFDTPIWQAGDYPNLIQIRSAYCPPPARGECVTLATEAGADVVIYWDGETFKSEQPEIEGD